MTYITRIAAIGVAILGAAMAFDQPELWLLVASIVVWLVSESVWQRS